QGCKLRRQIWPERRLGGVQALSSCGSACALERSNGDEVAAIDPIEQQLLGVRRSDRGPQVIRQVLVKPLDDLEQIARGPFLMADNERAQTGAVDRFGI